MSRKKEVHTHLPVSQENEAQAEHLHEQYHHIAGDLHVSSSREQAEGALAEISNMPEATQMALLKILSKEYDTDAADVLNALHELSPNKNIRKEARRSLIHLEGARVYPDWSPPATDRFATMTSSPPRFWKGVVTEMREQGEIQLVLCWEQGVDYNEARALVFLLDFWEEGVKDFFTRTGTKRRIDSEMTEMAAKSADIKTADSTLAEGRRLIEEALSVNKWRGTTPHKDYRHNLPIINQLVWQASDVGEDRGRTFISPDLDAEEVAANFAGGWALGDFGLAYDLLASGSILREGLRRDEWIERRRAWANEADPGEFSISFINERDQPKSMLWVPTQVFGSHASSRKEVEIGWSLELQNTPLSGTLREMAMGTAANKETGRHWFWTSYTLAQENGEWRIQSMTDEGANLQGLPINELQKQSKELHDRVDEIVRERQPNDAEAQEIIREILRLVTQAMHYSDALMVKLPLDRSVYAEAVEQAQAARAIERATVYLDRMAQRFPERRGDTLRQLGVLLASLKEMYDEGSQWDRSEQFYKLAQKALRDSIAADNAPLGYALLAEMLIQHGEEVEVEEAEKVLHEAEELDPSPAEAAVIETSLGNIALYRNQQDEGLKHFLRAAEISPNYPAIWYNIGHIQYALERYEEAVDSLKRAIEVENDLRAYGELAAVYMELRRTVQARETLEQGLRVHPQSAHLRAILAAMLLGSGENRHAQELLEEAERINPDLEMVKTVRQVMDKHKKR
jgi:tetratricopeptide (TPR) repeat protein